MEAEGDVPSSYGEQGNLLEPGTGSMGKAIPDSEKMSSKTLNKETAQSIWEST